MVLVRNEEEKIVGYVNDMDTFEVLKNVSSGLTAEEIMPIDVDMTGYWQSIIEEFWKTVHRIDDSVYDGCIACAFMDEDGNISISNCAEMYEEFKHKEHRKYFNDLVVTKTIKKFGVEIPIEDYPDDMLNVWNKIVHLRLWEMESNDCPLNLRELMLDTDKVYIVLDDEGYFSVVNEF